VNRNGYPGDTPAQELIGDQYPVYRDRTKDASCDYQEKVRAYLPARVHYVFELSRYHNGIFLPKWAANAAMHRRAVNAYLSLENNDDSSIVQHGKYLGVQERKGDWIVIGLEPEF
jgi:hypothetical protein